MSLKQCCATGSLHAGTPAGKLATVHGLKTYSAPLPEGNVKGTIVILPDAFGLALPNNRILADDYAKHGFRVYLPDFMSGADLPADALISLKAMLEPGFWNQFYKIVHLGYLLRFVPFWLYGARYGAAHPKIVQFLSGVRKDFPHEPIGVAGFCWGGKHVFDVATNKYKTKDGTRLIDAGFTAHPSLLKYPDDIDGAILPVSVAASEHDPQMSAEQAKQTEHILNGKNAKSKDNGISFEFVMYPGTHHGFAVRADENDKLEAEAGKKAEAQAVAWFNKWFASPPSASV